MFTSWALGAIFGYLICDIVNGVKKRIADQRLCDAMQQQQLNYMSGKSMNDEIYEKEVKR